LNILVIADPHLPVPPPIYGGTERIVHLFCKGLCTQGHQVNLLAGKGSQYYGGRLIFHQQPNLSYPSRAFRKILFQGLSAINLLDSDVVVNFGRVDYLELILRTSKPLICRFANPILQSEVDYLKLRRKHGKNLGLIGISKSQINHLRQSEEFQVVYNGVEISTYDFISAPQTLNILFF
jgi:glycosyltransferase involved in cell wall biosynthesis